MIVSAALADQLMAEALHQAELALAHGDVPIGAVVARLDGSNATTATTVATGHNRREIDADPTAHAEVIALRAAAEAVGTWRLNDCVLVVTLEPCPMCAGAALNARVGGIVFGAADPKAGACGTLYNFPADPRLNHGCEVLRGVRAERCGDLLRRFFNAKRLPKDR